MDDLWNYYNWTHGLEAMARKMCDAEFASLWGGLDLRELDAELQAKYAEGFRLLTPP